jgi:Phosphoenolpyruvate hydrolase-like/Uncharacterised protein family (UPF0261)
LPLRGLSLLSAEGGRFHDPELDCFFFDYLKRGLPPKVSVVEVDCTINDERFSRAAVDALTQLMASMSCGPSAFSSPSSSCTAAPAVSTLAPCTALSGALLSPPLSCAASLKPKAGSNRAHLVERLRAVVHNGQPIIGAGAGAGISAKFEERGGADIIIIYNSGLSRFSLLTLFNPLLHFSPPLSTSLSNLFHSLANSRIQAISA